MDTTTQQAAPAGERASGACDEVGKVLESRATFYRMLASLYFKTLTQEQIDTIAAMDLSAYAGLNDDFAAGTNDITRYLAKRNTGTRNELAADFTGAFTGTKAYEGKTAVPYESVFTSEDGLLYQESYQEVFTAFKRERVKLAEGVDWPADHLSFMFEFLAILSDRVEKALAEGDREMATHELETSRDFIHQHILNWFDQFESAARNILETRFYRGVLEITRGFLKLDLETINDLLAQVRGQEDAPEA